MSNKKTLNKVEIIGVGEGLVNQNSKEFKELQKLIITRASELSEEERITNQLLSIRFQMESYLADDNPQERILVGHFLENFIEVLKIKKKEFAKYIDYRESNLSAIFKGRRKINIDLAIKFGEIFNTDPVLWLYIQNKNELNEIIGREKEKYGKYKLEDLLKTAN